MEIQNDLMDHEGLQLIHPGVTVRTIPSLCLEDVKAFLMRWLRLQKPKPIHNSYT